MRSDLDALGLAALVLSTVSAAFLLPDLSLGLLGQPGFHAMLVTAGVLTLVVVLRSRGRRGSVLERAALALFLALMPSVYLMSGMRNGASGHWLGLELVGQVVFAALAYWGFRSQPWALAAGIAAHGLLWDSWHHNSAPFMPDWYPPACLIVDVGWGFYVATQVSAWRRSGATAGLTGRG